MRDCGELFCMNIYAKNLDLAKSAGGALPKYIALRTRTVQTV